MSQLTSSIGINISEESVQLVEIVKIEDQYFIENLDEEFFEESLNPNTKEAKYIHILQNSFNEIILRKPLNSDSLSITLPPSFFQVIDLPSDKNLNKNDLDDYVKWEISKLFPAKINDYYAFDKIVVEIPSFYTYNRIIVFTIPVVFLKLIHKFAVRNNLKLKSIDNAHIAAVRLFINDIKEVPILSIFIEYGTFSYFLLQESTIIFECTKKYKNISEITQITEDVFEEIRNRSVNKSDIMEITLQGNYVNDELKNNLKDSMRVDLREIDPFSRLSISEHINEERIADQNIMRFLPAISASLRI